MTEGTSEQLAPSGDIRPIVAGRVHNRGIWLFAGIAAIGAVGMFSALEARRSSLSSPAIAFAPGSEAGMIGSPPELAIPAEPQNYPAPLLFQPTGPAAAAPNAGQRAAPAARARSNYTFAPIGGAVPFTPNPPTPYAQPSPGYGYAAPQLAPLPGAKADAAGGDGRAQAARLANPATTVPQGTVIQAVLETALDSNRAGFARAIVSRDVSSFDGSHVLIPKGSKLFGEYKSDLDRGQNRALIQWHRLTRPDGTIIDVDSPSADPLGRAGVKGKVNSHFLARFGGTILQSALDIGVLLATRKATGDTVILTTAPPNMEGMVGRKPEDIKPTLTVKQGTSVSIFVVRDLDFTGVEP